jgi:hypothetical protein
MFFDNRNFRRYLDPIETALLVFSLFFNTLFKLSISLANNNPKHFFSVGKIEQYQPAFR